MKTLLKLTLLAIAAVAIVGCTLLNSENKAPLYQSPDYYNYLQSSYSDYLKSTKAWLEINRDFISPDREKELAMNMPFELGDKSASEKAILLVHGLGDSPFSFSDLAKSLANQGFYVQTLLLPGHGSKPSDLMLPTYADWQGIVDHYASLLKRDFDKVWLGGFSTGGNLVTIHSLEQGDVDGLMLFSPGFQSKTPKLERLAPFVALFIDGYEAEEKNLARYTSAPLKGAIAYSDSAVKLRSLLNSQTLSMPTLIVLSEADSVVDPEAVRSLYQTRFNNPNNQLIWYGESTFDDKSIQTLTMKLASSRVSTGSHMSPLFAKNNSYYGVNGEHLMCMNSFDDDANSACENGAEVWYSAWGYEEQGKIHARLTWNPYYSALEHTMATIVQ
ncbi:alpha/beta fold hydrolase [Endozoicomonas sp. G2_1]|uniref:alpha/beta hydrolase n=1 Tax=Endozoicomonas sp. G2_1 TaxID=2821091 RepID=UPI001ADB1A81|nr:alpha/beta fold hydrolase [Endozoicomonas sp. G2_1]MBO9488803.1 alpha/beta fold hydrolase [Endozoicomonas sp. G2_1]